MEHVDDRTEAQKKTHTIIVAMTDSFMSSWGRANEPGYRASWERDLGLNKDGLGRGTSYCGWACLDKDRGDVEAWVRSRSDALRVRVVGTNWRPKGRGHTHIYVVEAGHPALSN